MKLSRLHHLSALTLFRSQTGNAARVRSNKRVSAGAGIPKPQSTRTNRINLETCSTAHTGLQVTVITDLTQLIITGVAKTNHTASSRHTNNLRIIRSSTHTRTTDTLRHPLLYTQPQPWLSQMLMKWSSSNDSLTNIKQTFLHVSHQRKARIIVNIYCRDP